MKIDKRWLGRFLVWILTLVVLGFLVIWFIHARNELRAYETVTRMVGMMSFLNVESPESVDRQSLETILMKYHREDLLNDAWGRPLIVEKASAGSGAKYRIISLGRDGLRGSCCTRFVHDAWDEDAVLEDTGWLQDW